MSREVGRAAAAPLARPVGGGAHPQRAEHAAVEQAVQRLARGALGGGVEHHLLRSEYSTRIPGVERSGVAST